MGRQESFLFQDQQGKIRPVKEQEVALAFLHTHTQEKEKKRIKADSTFWKRVDSRNPVVSQTTFKESTEWDGN